MFFTIASGALFPAASTPSKRILYIAPFTNLTKDAGNLPPWVPFFFFPPANVTIWVVFGSGEPPI